MNYKVSIVIEKDEYGYYAYCPELEGCQTQGDTLEEVMDNIKEAIELFLETLPQGERISCLSKEILTTSIEVIVGLTAPSKATRRRGDVGEGRL